MTAEIITIGDELLIGQVINTNQAYIAERLNAVGVHVAVMTTAGDDRQAILRSFRKAWDDHDIVIATGGLGPTHDDITKKVLCEFFNTDLVANEDVRAKIASLMQKRKFPWTASAEEQALVPRKAVILPNPVGTAPGMLFDESGKLFFALPGVPYEMKEIVDRSIVPLLASRSEGRFIRHLTLRTTGIPESFLAAKLGDIEPLLQGTTLAFLPSPRGVRLRISVEETSAVEAERRVRDVEQRIRAKVEKYIYGTGGEELEEVLGRILTERKLTIAVAESCTGGLIADRITNVSGSSAYFERGVVTYSDASKHQLLGVPEELLRRYGAVSREAAEAMAAGVRNGAGTDIGLSTTGIAGPTGGSPQKPVGLVWIGFADRATSLAIRFHFGDQRLLVKERASQAALELVRRRVLSIEL